MAVFDTHRVFQALTPAGFTERQAQALIDVGSDGYGALATKADVADVATKAELRELELRLRLFVGAYVAIASALVVAILGFLLAIFTGQFA